ncbi:hypothetical protein SEVIR_5G324600v4 [Setaria viridis]|uniref:O-methyltransferase domain-containing protein n=2 Tax=Setaria TaxID=4554 RepID=K3XJV8_SETIT|nr:hypothetical protein SETIT_5G321200v2 [Setaria italica]TKW16815.1 hypothetical protein SEVIR_5G324600v2 [Setaria viridis]
MDASRDGALATGDQLMQAQAELWNHVFAYTRSMSLRCAVELGIPDAGHRLGCAATVPDLAAALSLPPSRAPYLRRLMRLLAHAGFFAFDGAAASYGLTPLSHLLCPRRPARAAGRASRRSRSPCCTPPSCRRSRSPCCTPPSCRRPCSWRPGSAPWTPAPLRRTSRSRPRTAATSGRWRGTTGSSAAFNDAMACDGRFVMDVLVRDHRDVFRGLATLVDVGGGSGGAARAIAAAFPHVRCSVLELPHVVAGVPQGERGGVEFVAGDMFENVPKWILHGWDDEKCVRILRRCREAIPSREAGGRVIVMDLDTWWWDRARQTRRPPRPSCCGT